MTRPPSEIGEPVGLVPAYGFTARWEFECCGTAHRVGDVVTAVAAVDDDSVIGPWNRLLPRAIAWDVGHHDDGSTRHSREARILRIWAAWSAGSPASARLMETGSTTPHSGSEEAQTRPRPAGVHDGEGLSGWVLQLDLLDPTTTAS